MADSVCQLVWRQRMLICGAISGFDWQLDRLDILAGMAEPVIMGTLTFW